MKNSVLYIGQKFQINTLLKEYIDRQLQLHFGQIDTQYFYDQKDKNLFLHLEKILIETNINLTIVCTKESFTVMGKLLCTLTKDNQVLKDGILMPSKTTIYTLKSYLLEHDKIKINVVQAQENQTFPDLLIENKNHFAYLQVIDIEENVLKSKLEPLARSYSVELEYTYIVDGWISVIAKSMQFGDIKQFTQSIRSTMQDDIIIAQNIFAHIVEQLIFYNKKITFAESCTGGLLASFLTAQSGSSAAFDGSLVSYSNFLKSGWLGVDNNDLVRFCAVSEPVVEVMIQGAINNTRADYAIATSGIAGPSGGTEDKPVGTVYIGVGVANNNIIERLFFEGDRNYIQMQSAYYGILMLLRADKKTFFTKG
jgi:nicotinamide-nucleotide amidase